MDRLYSPIAITGSLKGTASFAATSAFAEHVEYADVLDKPTIISSSLQFTSADDVTFDEVTASFIKGNIVAQSLILSGSDAQLTSSWSEHAVSSSYALSSSNANYIDFNNILNKPSLISSSLQFTSSDTATFGNVTSSNLLVQSLQITSSITPDGGSISQFVTINVNGVNYKLALYTLE
jgi:hypothetical protein